MSNNPPRAAAIGQLRNLEDVEASGKFVSEKNSGIPLSSFYYWRNTDPPRLVLGALVGDEIADGQYFQERLMIINDLGVRAPKNMFIYDRLALKRCQDDGKSQRATKRAEWRTGTEEITARGEIYVRQSYVRKLFGISEGGIRDWDARGWPPLGGELPRQNPRNGSTYYAKEQVDDGKTIWDALLPAIPGEEFTCPGCPHEMRLSEFAKTIGVAKTIKNVVYLRKLNVNLAKCPKCGRNILIPDPHIYSLKEASKKVKLAKTRLRDDEGARSLGLAKQYYPVRIAFKHGKDKQRAQRKLVQYNVGFTRASVDALARRQSECAVPTNAITLDEAWKQFDRRSTLSRSTIGYWCEEGLLDSMLTERWTKTGFREGWIILEKSIKGSLPSVEDALAIIREVGWDTAKTTKGLRNLRRQRIEENDGQVPASRLVKSDSNSVLTAQTEAQPSNQSSPYAEGGQRNEASSQTGGANGAASPKKRRGPRRSAITQQIYTACYDLLAEGKNSRPQIRELLKERFSDPKYKSSLPKSDSEVTTYASRRARDPEDPKPWPVRSRRT